MNGEESQRIYDKLDSLGKEIGQINIHVGNRMDRVQNTIVKRFDSHREHVEEKIDEMEREVLEVRSDYSSAKKLVGSIAALWAIITTYLKTKGI